MRKEIRDKVCKEISKPRYFPELPPTIKTILKRGMRLNRIVIISLKMNGKFLI